MTSQMITKRQAELVNRYSEADFFISSAFNNKEAAAFASAYSGSSSSGLSRGTKELFQSVNSRSSVNPVHHRSTV